MAKKWIKAIRKFSKEFKLLRVKEAVSSWHNKGRYCTF